MAVFWDVVPYNMAEVYRRLEVHFATIFRAYTLMMEALSTPKRR